MATEKISRSWHFGLHHAWGLPSAMLLIIIIHQYSDLRYGKRKGIQLVKMQFKFSNCGSFPRKQLRDRLGTDDIISVLQQNTLWWYGHVLQKEDSDWVKKWTEYEMEGSRPRGRPKTWFLLLCRIQFPWLFQTKWSFSLINFSTHNSSKTDFSSAFCFKIPDFPWPSLFSLTFPDFPWL